MILRARLERLSFSPSGVSMTAQLYIALRALYKQEVPWPAGARRALRWLRWRLSSARRACKPLWSGHLPPQSSRVPTGVAHTIAARMPSRTARYARYSPRQRRRRLLADRSVHFPNDVLFLDHIRQGDLEQVGRFIRARKVSLDTIHPSGLAALHEAVLSGNLECVKLLVKYGADIHQRDETGWTPLHIACSDGYPDIARYLISLGADREAANDDGDLPSDLIDPDFKDLVELFKGTKMD
ncbi:protein phosphatase 1 regulatory subunit 27 [Balaenoptera ricei]|uniref:Protein phosphatase 1 regulatory subunit 27 n=3 Tax=Balaenoptera TaxID=9766 RepID=A0A8C0DS93_BALMU|nr:protein phosphatase 1 regulatory subunit 27 [Balaenoptera ricei]